MFLPSIRNNNDPIMYALLSYVNDGDETRDEHQRSESLRNLLLQNSSVLNSTRRIGMAYLHLMCANSKSTPALLDIMVDCGADVRLPNMFNQTPLELSICQQRDEAFLLALVEKGVLTNVGPTQPPYLCMAVTYASPMSLIALIIKNKSFGLCRMDYVHRSLFHCAVNTPHPSGTVNILKKLHENNLKIDVPTHLMCVALSCGNDAETIGFLKEKGVPLECTKHKSIWYCLGRPEGSVITKDFVKLLDEDLIVKDPNLDMDPLLFVLQKCRYDTEGLELMLNMVKGIDLNTYIDSSNNSLLHLAICSKAYSISTLKLLIDRGVNINCVNEHGVSPLEEVLSCPNDPICPNVVEFLLGYGAELKWSVVIKVLNGCSNVEIFRLLLSTGVQLGDEFYKFLSVNGGKRFFVTPIFEYLLRCVFLELSNMDVRNIRLPDDIPILESRDECLDEIKRLQSKIFGPGRTLWDLFFGEGGTLKGVVTKTEQKISDFDLLLGAMGTDPYPMYVPIFADRVGRPVMERKLQEVPLYTSHTIIKDLENGKKKHVEVLVTLNNDCRMQIAQKLNNVDLFNLLLAYNNSKLADTILACHL